MPNKPDGWDIQMATWSDAGPGGWGVDEGEEVKDCQVPSKDPHFISFSMPGEKVGKEAGGVGILATTSDAQNESWLQNAAQIPRKKLPIPNCDLTLFYGQELKKQVALLRGWFQDISSTVEPLWGVMFQSTKHWWVEVPTWKPYKVSKGLNHKDPPLDYGRLNEEQFFIATTSNKAQEVISARWGSSDVQCLSHASHHWVC